MSSGSGRINAIKAFASVQKKKLLHVRKKDNNGMDSLTFGGGR
jgi:hypothetical protein